MKFKFHCKKLGFKSMDPDFCSKYIAKNLPKQNVKYEAKKRGRYYFPCLECSIGKKIIARGVAWKHVWKSGC